MVGYLILIIVAIYFVRIVFIVISWHTAKPYITHGQQQSVSIVIPFRNESSVGRFILKRYLFAFSAGCRDTV